MPFLTRYGVDDNNRKERENFLDINDADKAQDYLDRLIAKLRGVLDSMGDEIGMKELIAQLVDIERLQRQSYLQLRDHHNFVEEVILNQAIGAPTGKQ